METNTSQKGACTITGVLLFCVYFFLSFAFFGLAIYIPIERYYKSLDNIPGLNEKLLSKNPLIRAIDSNYEMVMGDIYMNGDLSISQLLKTHKTRITSLSAVVLTSNYNALVDDVSNNNGTCKAMCNHFNVVYNVAAGHLHMKGYIYFPEAMKKLKNTLKTIITQTVKNIHRKDTRLVLEAVQELRNNLEIIQPVYDFFIE